MGYGSNDGNLAPIVLFVYNRPEHTRRTLEALTANDLADQSMLYIYSDGPKYGALDEDLARVDEVRRVIRGRQWCREVRIIESEYNRGLADSIVAGVTEVVNHHGKVIVLEDDIVTRKGFLRYMNEALNTYAGEERVMQVSGYMYPARYEVAETTFFLRLLACWGWGTWARAWKMYSWDASAQYRYWSESRERIGEFKPWFVEQLRRNAEGELYTWAVRWYASWMAAGGFSLFPWRSLVRNIGHDASGVHCGANTVFDTQTVESITVQRMPVVEHQDVRAATDAFFAGPHFSWADPYRPRQRGLRGVIIRARRIPRMRKLRYRLFRGLCRLFPELQPLSDPATCWGSVTSSLREVTLADRTKLHPPYRISHATIGDYTYLAPNSRISLARIGKFCSIGPNFCCGWGVHPVDGISTSPMFYSTAQQNGVSLSKYNKVQERRPIQIGNDVFIGMNVTVLDGVTIGDGAVIGAGCVVSKDVPPYAIVVGNPMRILRYRFSREIIEQLQELAWWDWPEDKLKEVEEHFFDVEAFVTTHLGNT